MDAQLAQNAKSYSGIYATEHTFLRYPADWIIRFHNVYLKKNLPRGAVLDFGCGSGNNMKFLADQGYDVSGTDITDDVLPLVIQNGVDPKKVVILDSDMPTLPFADNSFDVVLSNQVLYYLASEDRIRAMCVEFHRVLKPGGVVFFTMMGPKGYYITDYAKEVSPNIYEVKIDGGHRLQGFHQFVYLVKDDEHLKDLFSRFQCISTGYFDQSMFDIKSNFHWIFAGRSNKLIG